MKRFRPPMMLTSALLCGVAATSLALSALRRGPDQQNAAPQKVTPVVVAVRDIEAGAVLSAADVRTVSWPADAVPAGYFSNPQEAIGQGLVLPLRANEPVLVSKLVDGETGGGLQIQIPPGMRAVSVRVDEVIGVAGFIQRNARVDVMVTLASTNGAPPATRVVLHNVQTLAVGRAPVNDTTASSSNEKDPAVITLLVTPAQAEQLALAAAEGRVQLALRNPLDQDRPMTTGATLASLARVPGAAVAAPVAVVASAPPAAPAARRPAPLVRHAAVVELLQGDERENVVVQTP